MKINWKRDILVVDDDIFNHDAIEYILESLSVSYNIIKAYNG